MSLNTFPLMEWETIDGLFLAALAGGLLLSARPLTRPKLALAMLALGLAAVTKQSFAPLPLVGLLLVLSAGVREDGSNDCWLPSLPRHWRRDSTWRGSLGEGGVGQMVTQFTSAGHVPSIALGDAGRNAVLIAMLVVGGGLIVRASPHLRQSMVWFHSTPIPFLTAVSGVSFVALRAGLVTRPEWAYGLELLVVATVTIQLLQRRRIPRAGVWILALAASAQLSFGVPQPVLVAGAMFLYLLHSALGLRPAEAAVAPRRLARWPLRHDAWIAGLAVVLAFSLHARTTSIYRDGGLLQLTAAMPAQMPMYWGLHTNPQTALAARQVVDCAARHPAGRLQVVPDFPAAWLALNKQPALNIDLLYPNEFTGSEAQVLERIDRLNHEGDFLVMAQTWDLIPDLSGGPAVDLARPGLLYDYNSSFYRRALQRLQGQRLICGSFLAVYRP